MALRFQGTDEVDQAAKEERATSRLILLFVFMAAIQGVSYWLAGKSLAEYEEDLAWLFVFGIAYWFLAPFYYEIRFRTKEIDGKVSSIEEAVIAAKEDRTELLERLAAIEDKMDAMQLDLESRSEPT